MKTVLAAAACVALLAVPAAAQTETPPARSIPPSTCETPPAQPDLPSAASATREQMEAAMQAYNAWYDRSAAIVRCLNSEYETLRAQGDARLAEHNRLVESLNASNAAWTAEVQSFNAGGSQRR